MMEVGFRPVKFVRMDREAIHNSQNYMDEFSINHLIKLFGEPNASTEKDKYVWTLYMLNVKVFSDQPAVGEIPIMVSRLNPKDNDMNKPCIFVVDYEYIDYFFIFKLNVRLCNFKLILE